MRRGIEALSRHQDQNLVSSAGFRAPVYEAGGRTFESCTRCHPCRASSTGRAAASKAEGSRFDPVVRCQTSRRSQVAEGTWLQARRRKPASVRIGPSSPSLVGSVDRAVGFYPMGRPFESVTRHQIISPVAQLAERLAVNQEVRRSRPRRGARFSLLFLGVAQLAAHVLREHGVAGSRPAAETNSACAWVWP